MHDNYGVGTFVHRIASSVNFPVGIGAAGLDSSRGIATSAEYGEGKECFTATPLRVLHHKFSTHDKENLPCVLSRRNKHVSKPNHCLACVARQTRLCSCILCQSEVYYSE